MASKRPVWSYSLKNRVAAAFLVSSLITFTLLGAASYYTIYSILYNKIDRGIEMTMKQLVKDLNLTLYNLTSVSQQLSYGGLLSGDMEVFLTEESMSVKRRHYDNINNLLNLVDHTNPNIGLHFYFWPENGERLFANRLGTLPFPENSLQVIAQEAVYAFHGPHATLDSRESGLVLSLMRPVDVTGETDLMLYVETSPLALGNVLEPNRLGMEARYVVIGQDGRIAYSELADYEVGQREGSHTHTAEHLIYRAAGEHGWTLLAAVESAGFNKEIREWVQRMLLLGVGIMLVSLLLGFLIWRTVYTPIRIFKKEITLMGIGNLAAPSERTGVAEFDSVMHYFQRMKERIQTLLTEVQQKERDKRHLEVEKLLAQINPHFLYNTLNTVQWIARSEGQSTIVRLVASLTRLLRYNLGKEGSSVTIEQELTALKDYIALQLVRSDYQFQVEFDVDEAALAKQIPRFILQPLVENAIYHGLGETKGTIRIAVSGDAAGAVQILVSDDGAGLSAEQVSRLLGQERDRGSDTYGLGIGLSYVNKMLEVHYGEGHKLQIDSREGEGTRYAFVLPAEGRELR